jgi:hypothetical protein
MDLIKKEFQKLPADLLASFRSRIERSSSFYTSLGKVDDADVDDFIAISLLHLRELDTDASEVLSTSDALTHFIRIILDFWNGNVILGLRGRLVWTYTNFLVMDFADDLIDATIFHLYHHPDDVDLMVNLPENEDFRAKFKISRFGDLEPDTNLYVSDLYQFFAKRLGINSLYELGTYTTGVSALNSLDCDSDMSCLKALSIMIFRVHGKRRPTNASMFTKTLNKIRTYVEKNYDVYKIASARAEMSKKSILDAPIDIRSLGFTRKEVPSTIGSTILICSYTCPPPVSDADVIAVCRGGTRPGMYRFSELRSKRFLDNVRANRKIVERQFKEQRKFLMPEQPKKSASISFDAIEEYIRVFNARVGNEERMYIANIDTKTSTTAEFFYRNYGSGTPVAALVNMLDPELKDSYMSRYLFALFTRLWRFERRLGITSLLSTKSDEDERSDERPQTNEIPIESRTWSLVKSVPVNTIDPAILEILKNPVGTTVLSGGCVVSILSQRRYNGDYDIYTNNPELHKMCDDMIVTVLNDMKKLRDFDAARINFQIFLYNYLNEHFDDTPATEFVFTDGTSIEIPSVMGEVPLEELLNMTNCHQSYESEFPLVVENLTLPADAESCLKDLFLKTELEEDIVDSVVAYINMYKEMSSVPNTQLDRLDDKNVNCNYHIFPNADVYHFDSIGIPRWIDPKSIPFIKARYVGRVSRLNLAEFKQHIKNNISLYKFKMLLLPFEPSISSYGYVRRYRKRDYRIDNVDGDYQWGQMTTLSSLDKPISGIFNLDIDFIDVTYPGLEKRFDNPQDFIKVEFDFDIVKNYAIYNPRTNMLDVYSLYPELWIGGSLPCFNLSFHKDMTINTHKRITTINRIYKYKTKGYKYIGPVLRPDPFPQNPTGLPYESPFIDLESLVHPFTQEEIDRYLSCLNAYSVRIYGRFEFVNSIASENAVERESISSKRYVSYVPALDIRGPGVNATSTRDDIVRSRPDMIYSGFFYTKGDFPPSVLPDGKLVHRSIHRYYYEDLRAVFDMYKSDPKRGAKYMIHFSNELGLNMFAIFPKTLYASTIMDLEKRGLNAIDFATNMIKNPSADRTMYITYRNIWERRLPFLDIALREISEGIYDENVHRIPFYIPEVDRLARAPARVKIDNDQIAWDTA